MKKNKYIRSWNKFIKVIHKNIIWIVSYMLLQAKPGIPGPSCWPFSECKRKSTLYLLIYTPVSAFTFLQFWRSGGLNSTLFWEKAIWLKATARLWAMTKLRDKTVLLIWVRSNMNRCKCGTQFSYPGYYWKSGRHTFLCLSGWILFYQHHYSVDQHISYSVNVCPKIQ